MASEDSDANPDPNLVCGICFDVFRQPSRIPCGYVWIKARCPNGCMSRARSACTGYLIVHLSCRARLRRHIFCRCCLEEALMQAGQRCPCCRATTSLDDAVPDRLAAALVANLRCSCPFRSAGCAWTGNRGSLNEHLATTCAHVLVRCPTCNEEVPRGELGDHQLTRGCGLVADCPWGCGARLTQAQTEVPTARSRPPSLPSKRLP